MATGSALYESPDLVAGYLLFHYGNEQDHIGAIPVPFAPVGFAQRLVQVLLDGARLDWRALDVGCAVGGSSFELARRCERVVGIDFSNAFIDAAKVLQRNGHIATRKRVEGKVFADFEARVDPSIDRARVDFLVGDACDLPLDLGAFDVVVAANLICRLPDPMAFLDRLPELVLPGGQLLLTTPFTWMEDYTPVGKWLGATPETGDSFGALSSVLSKNFDLELEVEIPFLIREHRRKFQLTVSKGSRWRRRAN